MKWGAMNNVQWNPSKMDNLVPQFLSIYYSGVSTLEGLHACMYMYLTIGTQRFVHFIEVSAI